MDKNTGQELTAAGLQVGQALSPERSDTGVVPMPSPGTGRSSLGTPEHFLGDTSPHCVTFLSGWVTRREGEGPGALLGKQGLGEKT